MYIVFLEAFIKENAYLNEITYKMKELQKKIYVLG